METDPRFQRGIQDERRHLTGLVVLIVFILAVVFTVDCINRPVSMTTTTTISDG